jgi:AmmeMemoRadiSam system protein A
MLTKEQQKKLLNLARKAIEHYMFYHEFYIPNESEFQEKVFHEVHGVFVTLTEDDKLRGCIGNIEGVEPLYISVAHNAVNAAFYDPRFYPLEPNEIDLIKIEISILSSPKEFKYSSPRELVNMLEKGKPGVILSKTGTSATFLPQVWEQISSSKEFLSHLCLKAGLSESCWQDNDVKIKTYTVNSFEE